VVSYQTLLGVFFSVHDPTTLNRQGADVGTQYRSVIFYHDESQHEIAKLALVAASESGEWDAPIVTEISAFTSFYPAEEYHDDYFNRNPDQPYCALVVKPKVDKFLSRFKTLLKK
jgi:peptide-methionine (S)-S-oxide reductase